MNFKPGDLCKLLHADYGWNEYDIEFKSGQYTKYKPLIKENSATSGMIVEVQLHDQGLHVVVWVPELNGYTFMHEWHLEKISK